jgi:hypothetical protein
MTSPGTISVSLIAKLRPIARCPDELSAVFTLIDLWNRIVSAPIPRIAAQDTPRRQPASFDRTVPTQRLNAIAATRWMEPAVRPDNRAHDNLPEAHSSDDHSGCAA